MKKNIAIQLMDDLEKIGNAMNLFCQTVEAIDSLDEKKLMRRGIGELMGLSFTELMLPIIREFPELDPDNPNIAPD